MKIKIEQKHIDKGRRYNAKLCPIALAMKDVLGDGCMASRDTLYRYNERFNTPQCVVEFMRNYDAGWKVEPMEFELNI